jgi:FkbM family methyltransferase
MRGMSQKCDNDFIRLLKRYEHTPVETLLEQATENAAECARANPGYYAQMRHFYAAWYAVGDFTPEDTAFTAHFGPYFRYIQENASGFARLYNRLCDYRSKYSLRMMLQNWLTFTPDLRYHSIERTFPNYFDLDLFPPAKGGDVFVDCGAYDGDSIKSFTEMYGFDYKRIYAYEIVPDIFKTLQENLKDYPNIVFCNRGVADKAGECPLAVFESASSIVRGFGEPAPVVALDDDIDEEITFIKMDIEGAEPLALTGAQRHIQRSRPKLAVCLYHTLSHLLEIPALIHEIEPDYRLYFRHLHDPKENGIPFPIEYMVYAN